MDTAVRSILETFERLGVDEQLHVVRALLLRTRELELPPVDEETVDRIAEESFLEYDALEAADDEG